MSKIRRYRIEVSGTVQGVGFRPFIYRLAIDTGLNGFVFNHDRGVTIETEGAIDQLTSFLQQLPILTPPASRITSIHHHEIPSQGASRFEILESPEASPDKFVPISPDLSICADCSRELWDPNGRRYFYPFINCTNCGPRFTIIKDVPYDRPMTTMASFPLCSACQAEYSDPANRRFHAQPNACPVCGPQISLLDRSGRPVELPPQENLNKTIIGHCVLLLREGHILAIKGLGGFHLACDALNERAVATLRSRKHREDKPFAVMFQDLSSIQAYATVKPEERDMLTSTSKPIVLVEKNDNKDLARSVAPGNRRLGVMLPYAPLHDLILKSFAGPLVMTSGNQSDEPIAYTNTDALARLSGIADYFLLNDREIHVRCDDSVVRAFRGKKFFIRRSRGFVPATVHSEERFNKPILGVGAQLKNTFCLAKNQDAIISHHIGDLENLATLEAFETGIQHFKNLFNIEPEYIAHDLHPEYLNTKWVQEKFNDDSWKGRLFGIQHHHAHIAACLEEHQFKEAAIGIALDGTGYGTDGTLWGGELLLADRRDFIRTGRMRPVEIPGGEQAIKNPWRIAMAYLHQTFPDSKEFNQTLASLPFLADISQTHISVVEAMLTRGLNSFTTSSCGRLFDAVSALLGIVTEAHYEGQPAVELENAIAGADLSAHYSFDLKKEGALLELDWRPVFRQIVSDILHDQSRAETSRRFHNGLVHGLVESCKSISQKYDANTVALGGGCFLNEYLRTHLTEQLELSGFKVLVPRRVPTNDGGIAFGQVVIANQIIGGSPSCVWRFR